jgi:hypothetical protein
LPESKSNKLGKQNRPFLKNLSLLLTPGHLHYKMFAIELVESYWYFDPDVLNEGADPHFLQHMLRSFRSLLECMSESHSLPVSLLPFPTDVFR